MSIPSHLPPTTTLSAAGVGVEIRWIVVLTFEIGEIGEIGEVGELGEAGGDSDTHAPSVLPWRLPLRVLPSLVSAMRPRRALPGCRLEAPGLASCGGPAGELSCELSKQEL